jgi:hypothetical protein
MSTMSTVELEYQRASKTELQWLDSWQRCWKSVFATLISILKIF